MNEFDQCCSGPVTDAQERRWAALLLLLWLLIGAALGAARLLNPAYGIQGDLPHHYYFTQSFARSLAEGEWLPRWAGLMDGGRGNALFTFYPPLYYWLTGGLVAVFGISALTALKVISLLGILLAEVSVYLLAREFFDRRPSALAAVAYVALPSYALIAFHRGFLSNALASGLFPLVLLGAHRLLTGKRWKRGLLLFSLGFSAVILTHVISAYLCALVIGLMAICYLPRVGGRGLWRLAGGTGLALVLTAFIWWPQFIEISWVQAERTVAQQDYRHYFLFAAPADGSRYRRSWADLNDVASLITLAQTALALVLSLIGLRFLSRSRLTPFAWLSLVLTLAGLLISLRPSEIIWRLVPGMKYIQFPWRFQSFVALVIAMLAAALIGEWKRIGRRARMALAAVLTWVVVANLVLTFLVARPQHQARWREALTRVTTPMNAPPLDPEQANRLRDDEDFGFFTYAANQIYFRPRGAELTFYPLANEVGGIEFIAGRGHLTTQQLMNAHREFQLQNEEPVRVRIKTYNYPNWVARLDGHQIQIATEQGSGLMLIDLPSGDHALMLDFELTNPSERWARVISVAAWLLLLGWIIWDRVSQAFFRSRTGP